MAVVERRKVTCPQLAQIVRRYCVKIAVTRGIIAEARRGLMEKWGDRAIGCHRDISIYFPDING
jgi:hypothetical protein